MFRARAKLARTSSTARVWYGRSVNFTAPPGLTRSRSSADCPVQAHRLHAVRQFASERLKQTILVSDDEGRVMPSPAPASALRNSSVRSRSASTPYLFATSQPSEMSSIRRPRDPALSHKSGAIFANSLLLVTRRGTRRLSKRTRRFPQSRQTSRTRPGFYKYP